MVQNPVEPFHHIQYTVEPFHHIEDPVERGGEHVDGTVLQLPGQPSPPFLVPLSLWVSGGTE